MATGISSAKGGDELLGAVGGYEPSGQNVTINKELFQQELNEDVVIDEELFQQELNEDDEISVDENLFNEEIADMTINSDDDQY